MRVIGLDIGEARIGVAVSDPDLRVATPLKVLEGALSSDPSRLRRLVDDYEAGAVIVGLPLTLAGEEGPQARRVRDEIAGVADALSVPVRFWDERLSSAEAKRVMGESGLSEKKKRGSVDMVAAAIILQGYLDSGGPKRDGIV